MATARLYQVHGTCYGAARDGAARAFEKLLQARPEMPFPPVVRRNLAADTITAIFRIRVESDPDRVGREIFHQAASEAGFDVSQCMIGVMPLGGGGDQVSRAASAGT